MSAQYAHASGFAQLDRSFERLDLDRLDATASNKTLRQEIQRAAQRARGRISDRAPPRCTEERGGVRRIVEEPSLITRLSEAAAESLPQRLDDYLATLSPHWQRVLGG